MIDLPPEAKALLEQARRDHNPGPREAQRVQRALYTKLGIAAAVLPTAIAAPASAATKAAVAKVASFPVSAASPAMASSVAASAAVAKATGTNLGLVATLWSLKASKIALAVVTLSGVASLPLVMRDAPVAATHPASSLVVPGTTSAHGGSERAVRPALLEPKVEQLTPTVEPLIQSAAKSVTPTVMPLTTSRAKPDEPDRARAAPHLGAAPATPPASGGARALASADEPAATARVHARPTRASRSETAMPDQETGLVGDDPLASVLPPELTDSDLRPAPAGSPDPSSPYAGPSRYAGIPSLTPLPTLHTDAWKREQPQELALIRSALLSLRDGLPARALAVLGDHAIRYPRGMFASERRGLRVIALCAAGRLDEGRELRKVFLREERASPMVDRVRNACQEASPP